MKKMHIHKIRKRNTILINIGIVFFLSLISSLILVNFYGKKMNNQIVTLASSKIDKVIYQFFSDLITDEVINKESVGNILNITKNDRGEILSVTYDIEKTYRVLTNVSNILKEGLSSLENGKIDIKIYDKYLVSKNDNLILNVPLFLNNKNPYLENLGPRLPVKINLNETLLTNVKTKVTNYGFNNALLEVYIAVSLHKLIIAPFKEETKPFNYDILIASLVVSGKVPEFYGSSIDVFSTILTLPNKV